MSEKQLENAEVTVTTSASSEMPQAPDQIQSTFTSLMPMLLIFVVFYFLLIRPQEKKRKAQEQMVSTAKPGEEVLLHCGIYGKITKVNEAEKTIIVEITKDTEIKVIQSAVADIISRSNIASVSSKNEDKKAPVKKKGK
ncbi:MAG: hypothetical protein RLZZ59_704 [Pseudomonadota bacterium]|jgi:preprotein translocase subunit YajC